MVAWDVADIEDGTNTIEYTWPFNTKIFTDGSINKCKAHFCARGDNQLEWVDLIETYAPIF